MPSVRLIVNMRGAYIKPFCVDFLMPLPRSFHRNMQTASIINLMVFMEITRLFRAQRDMRQKIYVAFINAAFPFGFCKERDHQPNLLMV